jgi:hypothetical protein
MDKVYLAIIATGQYEDYTEAVEFASKDKEKVTKWCDRFNNIIDSNKERIMRYDFEEETPPPFWYDFIVYYEPKARIKETKLI